MDTPAVALPLPIAPVAPANAGAPAPAEDAAAEGGNFASTLEQQLAQDAPGTLRTPDPKLLVPGDLVEDVEDTLARDAATPDSLIALISAPLFPQATPARAAGDAAQGGMSRLAAARSGGRDAASGASIELHAAPRAQPAAREIPVAEERIEAGLQATQAEPTVLLRAAEMSAAPLAGASPHVSLPATTSIAATAEPHIAARVGTTEWNDGLARQVTLMVKDGEQTAQLRLDPPDLGPLEVRLSMAPDQDGVAHAQFVSPHAAVREALEAALPQLRNALADSGITLGNASVGDGFVRDDPRQPQQSSAGGARNGAAADDAHGSGAGAPPQALRRGLVDTFA